MMFWGGIIILVVVLILFARSVDKGSDDTTRQKVFEAIKEEREKKQKKLKEVKELESLWKKSSKDTAKR